MKNSSKSLADMAVKLTGLSLVPPKSLVDEEARKEYKRLAKELVRLGHVSALNRNSLSNYAQAYSVAHKAMEQLEGQFILAGENGGHYMNPLLSVWKMALGVMEKEGQNLGMTPQNLQALRSINEKNKGGKKSTKSEEAKPSDFR